MTTGRIVYFNFSQVSVSATQDFFNITMATTAGLPGFALRSFSLGQITGTSQANLPISVRRFTATVTNGSAGSVATGLPRLGKDSVNATGRVNDTSVATTSGTAQLMFADVLNELGGYSYAPNPDEFITCTPGQAIIIRLDGAPSGAITMSGWCVIEELG